MPQKNNLECFNCDGTGSATLYYNQTIGDDRVHCHKCEETTFDPEIVEEYKTLKPNYEKKNNLNMSDTQEQKPKKKFPVRGIVTAMEDRGIRKEVMEKYGVEKLFNSEDEPYGFAYPRYNEAEELVGQKVKRTDDKNMTWLGTFENDLFGAKAFPAGGKFLTITEGEEDAMAAYQMMVDNFGNKEGFHPAVVSVFSGAGGAVKDCKKRYEYIDSFEQIILAFDGDPVGRDAAKKVARMFPHKVKIMTMPNLSEEVFTDPDNGKTKIKYKMKDACDYLKANKTKDFISSWWKSEKYVPKGVRTFRSLWDDMTKKDSNCVVPFPYEGMNKMCHGMVTGYMDVFKAPPKIGKCFGKDTRVLMWDGSVKKVQNIVEGDLLMGDDSTPRKVLSTVKGTEELFRVKQNKKEDYIVNKSHILSLEKSGTGKKIDVELEDYFKLGEREKWKGYARPVEKVEKFDELIPSYILGAWLGDGTSKKPEVSSVDSAVLFAFKEYAEEKGLNFKLRNRCTFSFTGIKGKRNIFVDNLKELGIFNNKRIPKRWFFAPMHKRLEVLAGLIDTDGFFAKSSTTEHGSYEITQKNKNLAMDIQKLAWYCGFSANIKEVSKYCVYKGNKQKGKYYRIVINGDLQRIPCRIERKRVTTLPKRNALLTGIEVTSIGEGTYYGFVLNGNHRFMLHDCTIVHNTTLLSELVMHIRDNSEYNTGVIFLESTTKQIGLKFCGIRVDKPWDRPEFEESIDKEQLAEIHDDISEGDRIVLFDPRDERTSENVLKKMMYFVKAHDVKFIFFDHASMLAYTSENMDERKFLDKLFADLKQMTTALDIYLGVVIHVNDDGKTRGSRAPTQLCDRTFALQRDKLNSDEVIANTTEIVVEENRWGGSGLASKIYYDNSTGRMQELDLDLVMEKQKEKERHVAFDD